MICSVCVLGTGLLLSVRKVLLLMAGCHLQRPALMPWSVLVRARDTHGAADMITMKAEWCKTLS